MVWSHFIPQFYLKNFSFNEKQLVAFDKKQNRSFQPTFKSQCARNDFFKLEGGEHFKELNYDPNYLENANVLCNEMEGPVSSILLEIIENKSISNVTTEQFQKLFSWFAWIYTMCPSNKTSLDLAIQQQHDSLGNLTDSQLQHLIQSSEAKITPEEFRNSSKNFRVHFSNAMKIKILSNSLDSIVANLFKFSWILSSINPEEGALITSDRPLMLAGNDLFKPIGFGSADYVFFPITPSLLLSGKRFTNTTGFASKLYLMSNNEIQLPNLLAYAKSERFVYSNNINSFNFFMTKDINNHLSLVPTFEKFDDKIYAFKNY